MLAALVSGAGFAYTVAPVHPPGVAVSRLTPACSRRAAVAVAQMPDAPPEIVSSEAYSLMIRALLETENSITSEIQNNYEMIDYGFLQMLDERITSSDGEEKEKLEAVKVACTTEMSNRVQAAAAALQDILQSPTPVVMEEDRRPRAPGEARLVAPRAPRHEPQAGGRRRRGGSRRRRCSAR